MAAGIAEGIDGATRMSKRNRQAIYFDIAHRARWNIAYGGHAGNSLPWMFPLRQPTLMP